MSTDRALEAARRLRETTEEMASHARGVSLIMWNRHSNACLDAADLIVVLSEEVGRMRWQPMPSTETPGVFPFNGQRMLVGWNDISALPMHVELGRWRSGTGRGSGWCNTYGHSFGGSPTHYMPLPTPPSSQPGNSEVTR